MDAEFGSCGGVTAGVWVVVTRGTVFVVETAVRTFVAMAFSGDGVVVVTVVDGAGVAPVDVVTAGGTVFSTVVAGVVEVCSFEGAAAATGVTLTPSVGSDVGTATVFAGAVGATLGDTVAGEAGQTGAGVTCGASVTVAVGEVDTGSLGTLVVVTLVLTWACGVGAVFTAGTVVTGGGDVAALADMVGVVLEFDVLACTVFTGVVIIVVVDFDGPA